MGSETALCEETHNLRVQESWVQVPGEDSLHPLYPHLVICETGL